MPRLSIDITAQEHQRLKAIAALKGQSIKQYVLSRTLKGVPDTSHMTDEDAYAELAKLLKPRISQARQGSLVTRSIDDLKQSARKRLADGDE